mgnify:CR=1 FL=1
MLSIALPHPWEDEGELVLHLFEECNSADRAECIGKVQGDQCPVWMVTQDVFDAMHYVLSTSWHANTKLHRGECARELLLEVTHDGRADELVEDGSYAMGLVPPSFLAMGIS